MNNIWQDTIVAPYRSTSEAVNGVPGVMLEEGPCHLQQCYRLSQGRAKNALRNSSNWRAYIHKLNRKQKVELEEPTFFLKLPLIPFMYGPSWTNH